MTERFTDGDVPVRGADADLEALIDSTEAFSALLPSDKTVCRGSWGIWTS